MLGYIESLWSPQYLPGRRSFCQVKTGPVQDLALNWLKTSIRCTVLWVRSKEPIYKVLKGQQRGPWALQHLHGRTPVCKRKQKLPFLATVLNLPSCEFLLTLSITPCSREPDYRKDLPLKQRSLFGVSQGAASTCM